MLSVCAFWPRSLTRLAIIFLLLAFLAQLSARYTGEENDLQQKKFESEKSPVSATPKWAPLKLYFKATQYGLMTGKRPPSLRG